MIDRSKEEELARLIVDQEGHEVILTTEYLDRHLHIDLIVVQRNHIAPGIVDTTLLTVDVKAARKYRSLDSRVSYTHTWLELFNVQGKPGSIQGAADVIALELEDRYILVDRLPLANDVYELWKHTGQGYVSNPNPLQFLQRTGRKDGVLWYPIERAAPWITLEVFKYAQDK